MRAGPEPGQTRNWSVVFARWLLGWASGRVPARDREEWLAEWLGELWALERRGAGRAALISFAAAGVADARRTSRRGEGWLTGLARDVRFAWRDLRRSPGFTLLVALVLGLGVGANAVLFGAIDAVLMDRTPYPSPDRMVVVDMLLERRAGVPADTMPWSYPKFELARDQLDALESVAGYTLRTGTFAGAGDPERVAVEYVSPAYFELLGVAPAIGRAFGSEEEEPSAAAAALLAHELWISRFGGDPGVIGRTITLDGAQLEIVGVADAEFRGVTGQAQLWVPLAGAAIVQGPGRLTQAWAHWFQALGRLAPGATLEQARTQATSLGSKLTEAFPDPSGDGSHGVALVPFLEARANPRARAAIVAASASALLLLLIACGNVAGLMLARVSARRSDIAVRCAVGATRGRVARERMSESLLLAGLGGGLGMAVAVLGQAVVRTALPAALTNFGTRNLQSFDARLIRLDAPSLILGVALVILTGLLFGVAPAYVAARSDVRLGPARGKRTVGGASKGIGRGILTAGQFAITLALLSGAGLLTASYRGLSAIDIGYRASDALVLMIERSSGAPARETRAFERELLDRVRALPGVASAAIAPCAPLQGRCEEVGLRQVDDGPLIDYGNMEAVLAYAVTNDYFRLIDVPVLEGRTFSVTDDERARPVAIVNQAAARELFPGQSAIGHRVAITHDLADPLEIVGVVGDVRYGPLEEPAMPGVYLSRAQAPSSYGTLFVASTAGEAGSLLGAVRAAIRELDPDTPVFAVSTLATYRAKATARTRAVFALLTTFALCGLLLSAVGLYGVVSAGVARRTGEIGLRMALGAAASRVLALVLRVPVLLAAAGAVAGLGLATAVTRYFDTLLYDVRPLDPRILIGATAVLLFVAFVAAWLPARRALEIAPADALKRD